MVRVDRLDVRGHLRDPAPDELARVIAAPRLVRELPREDRRIVPVLPAVVRVHAVQEMAHVVLVELLAVRVRVERIRARARRAPPDVLRHPAEVGPVVHEADQEPHAGLVRLVQHVVHRPE